MRLGRGERSFLGLGLPCRAIRWKFGGRLYSIGLIICENIEEELCWLHRAGCKGRTVVVAVAAEPECFHSWFDGLLAASDIAPQS